MLKSLLDFYRVAAYSMTRIGVYFVTTKR